MIELIPAVLLAAHASGDDPLTIGDPAPALAVAHWMKGEEVSDFQPEKIYVLEFWATWCAPCIANMEHLSAAQERYAPQGVSVIGLSDEPLQTTVAFLLTEHRDTGVLQHERTRYALATDPDRSVHRDYLEAARISGIPTVFIIGKSGVIEWIGHPSEMDAVLEAVVTDEWDLGAARIEAIAKRKENQPTTEAAAALVEVINTEQWEDALKHLDVLTDAGIEEYIPTKYSILLSRVRDYDRARVYASEVVEQAWADNPWLLYQVAWCTTGTRRYPVDRARCDLDLALRAAERAVELTATEPDEMYPAMLARVHAARGEFPEAIRAQKQAVALAEALRPGIPDHQLEGFGQYVEGYRKDLRAYLAGQVGD